jgi:hypothetical protein
MINGDLNVCRNDVKVIFTIFISVFIELVGIGIFSLSIDIAVISVEFNLCG